ncbi:hypothetical protein ACOSQ3_001025 [Xanthoceras sorbifolium]
MIVINGPALKFFNINATDHHLTLDGVNIDMKYDDNMMRSLLQIIMQEYIERMIVMGQELSHLMRRNIGFFIDHLTGTIS